MDKAQKPRQVFAMHPNDTAIDNAFAKIGAHGAHRHVFLCIGPDCCSSPEGEATWASLKAEIKALGIPVLRTKAACLRLCSRGPWMIVYPEGTWYGGVTPERCTRIVREHLQGNQPVAEWVYATHTLPANEACRVEQISKAQA